MYVRREAAEAKPQPTEKKAETNSFKRGVEKAKIGGAFHITKLFRRFAQAFG